MAKGHENLIPLNKRTKEEQRAITKKGGIQSGIVRKAQKNAREIALTLANTKLSPEDAKKFEHLGLEKDATYRTVIVASLFNKAQRGDVKAISKYLELTGDDLKMLQDMELKRKEYELRLRELELREKEFEHRVAVENGEVKEDEKVIIVNNLEELVTNGKGS